jgi:hypothetical protein
MSGAEDAPHDDLAGVRARRHPALNQRNSDITRILAVYLSYRSLLRQNERIELDINYLHRTPISGIETHKLWQPGALDRPNIRIVGMAELVIGKMLAFLDRGAVLDIWDVANLGINLLDDKRVLLIIPCSK